MDPYGEALPRLASLDSHKAALVLIAEYAADAPETITDAVGWAKNCLGWLLGEIDADAREEALRWLPEDVMHPVVGRDFRQRSFEEYLELGHRFAMDGNLHPLDPRRFER